MDDDFETHLSNYRTHVSWWLPWSFFCMVSSNFFCAFCLYCVGPPVVGSIPASNLIFTGSVQGTKTWTFLVVNPVVLWLNPNLSSCWIPPGFIARVIPIYRWSPPPLCWPSIRRCQPLQGLHHSTESREGSACKTSRIFLLNPIGWCMSSMIMTIMCVFIWLVEGWAFFHLIMIMSLHHLYIYILYTDLYIFFMDVNGAIWGLIIFVSGHDGKEKTWHDHDQTFFSHTFSLLNEFYISTVSWHLVYLNP